MKKSSGVIWQSRFNYAFAETVEDDHRVVKHLFHNQHQFSQRPATAYYMDEPKRVRRFRTMIHIAELGVSLVKLPARIKNMGQTFLKSFYKEQRVTEGSLLGYLEANSLNLMQGRFIEANSNPYLVLR